MHWNKMKGSNCILYFAGFLLIALVLFIFGLFWPILIPAIILVVIALNWTHFKIYIQTLPRDRKGLHVLLAVERDYKNHLKKGATVAAAFNELVCKHPSKCAFFDLETKKSWTFLELEEFSNKVANYFLQQGYQKDDVASLLAENGAKYVGLWLGLSKIGVITALINSNLKLDSLAYSLKAAKTKFIIVSKQLKPNFEACIDSKLVEDTIPVYCFSDAEEMDQFSKDLQVCSASSPKLDFQIDCRQVLLYVFTSGTTGMPKPAIINQIRYYTASRMGLHCFGVNPDDRLYITMPLYHTAAGMLGIGLTLTLGCTSVIRRKFSASSFWDDCVKNECTVSQYIGEICRYLIAQPFRPSEKMHKVRLMYGNGMRKEIWQDFIDRFSVPKIGEVYGSTEGNATLVNLDCTVGACGFLPVNGVVSDIYPVRLIRVDDESGDPVRGRDGLCVKCRPGQHGQMVGKIIKNSPVKEFTGYVSQDETDKKLIRNVFSKGDVAFSSGDILFMNERGYLFFKDRCGDTFRWKGENVSTVEVEGVVQKLTGCLDAAVYGLAIPKHDGKAGAMCLAIEETSTLDLVDLFGKLKEHSPVYAIPIFVRLKKRVELTGTFKYKKYQLQVDGFDPRKCGGDTLYYLDRTYGGYKTLTVDAYDQIIKGAIKF